METKNKPIVFISYSWRTYGHDPESGKPLRKSDERGITLAEDLREVGFDSRIDNFFEFPKYGFTSPVGRSGDPKIAWKDWAEEQIKAADSVLLLCTPEYNSSTMDQPWAFREWHESIINPNLTQREPFAFLWWDWHFMLNELGSDVSKQWKFIPVGFGPYESNMKNIPPFVQGLTYYNLDSAEDVTGLQRRIRMEYYKRRPKQGIFISYAHKDEPKWMDLLLQHLAPLKRKGVEIWTDKDIAAGANWHTTIQNALMNAKVALILVTSAFLNSDYVANHELPAFLQAAESEGLNIFWIPLKPSTYPDEITRFQAGHPKDVPLSTLDDAKLDQAFVDIVSKLTKSLGM